MVSSETGNGILSGEDRVADQFHWTSNELIDLQKKDPELQFVTEMKKSCAQKPPWKRVEG